MGLPKATTYTVTCAQMHPLKGHHLTRIAPCLVWGCLPLWVSKATFSIPTTPPLSLSSVY